ncbi:MAG: SDR family oxidoreductase [Novosphingobium sp.]|jgi:uncharacterized oxidoreductase|nr:SDR family NAD(P)-dependent oxidoreductase [Novosphingobium sp.]
MKLSNKTILLTGGSRGIGRALALQLLEHDPRRLVLVGRDQTMLNAVAAQDSRIVPIACNLADRSEVDRLVARIAQDFPDLAVLINNAGSQLMTELVRPEAPAHLSALRDEMTANFETAIALAIGVMPVLLAQPEAMIVNVTSGLALAPKQSSPIYCATKAGLRSFTKALRYQARRAAPHLRVIEALPPMVDTDMTKGRGKAKMSPEDCAAAILSAMLADRDTAYIGLSRVLRIVQGLSPSLADRLMRNA